MVCFALGLDAFTDDGRSHGGLVAQAAAHPRRRVVAPHPQRPRRQRSGLLPLGCGEGYRGEGGWGLGGGGERG
eukprot:COSAG02_NODE_49469_length_326_cov_1.356828_1_plen_72_part_01